MSFEKLKQQCDNDSGVLVMYNQCCDQLLLTFFPFIFLSIMYIAHHDVWLFNQWRRIIFMLYSQYTILVNKYKYLPFEKMMR